LDSERKKLKKKGDDLEPNKRLGPELPTQNEKGMAKRTDVRRHTTTDDTGIFH